VRYGTLFDGAGWITPENGKLTGAIFDAACSAH
jgi:hypothetical protein